MSKLYKVIEKTFCQGRRNFVMVGGLWWTSKEQARAAAHRLAPYSLAHRMFIFAPKAGIVEEVELEPLLTRMQRAHVAVLTSKNPDRLAREVAAQEERQRRAQAWSVGI
ncbi:hypothetical protein [Methylibium petroleiphilum]|uniref:Uncharacterized protein n=1 Tax=Methylibium petroleiphilum (strain ATCC BAA-1232 / LMG 22953 / PM1) TaxID=420662 RepID=A2SMP5_METPP|nr:hypothetical protein [Methylibium petroleiphilum]ABM96834.1 hypothetical protein Mpe_B0055 [Methylibium petroleiphilum PM1]